VPGKLGNKLWIQLWVLRGLRDTQCGFKGFTAEAAEQIFRLTRVTGWGFDIEALAIAKQLDYRVKEFPVRWVNDFRSRVRPSAHLKVLLETVKIRLWLWTGKYKVKSEDRLSAES
jgi:dolichyl-phosphate beta-glucosyltransferase